MPTRRTAALSLALAAAAVVFPASSLGAAAVEPRPGALLTGSIHFPRAQGMTLEIDARDTTRAKASVGFDGRCKGGGVGEFWAKFVPARETVRIRNGRFSAKLTGTTEDVGGVRGRDGTFHWRLKGRFLDPDTATASVAGKAEIRMGRHVVSRCRIARAGAVRLRLGE
jgi:hypothetical protein